MTRNQIEQLNNLRLDGLSPAEIARRIDSPAGTVRSYIARHPDIPGACQCKQCGKNMPSSTNGQPRIFCSAQCKNKWWNRNRTADHMPIQICKHCGKEFKSYGNKHYCSRECYLDSVSKS